MSGTPCKSTVFVGYQAMSAVVIVFSGKCIMEYTIWNNTDLLKFVHLLSADRALRVSVFVEVRILEHANRLSFES